MSEPTAPYVFDHVDQHILPPDRQRAALAAAARRVDDDASADEPED